MINRNGDKFWLHMNGNSHRENGLPACEWINGDKEWYVNNKRHRETPLGGSEGVGGLPAIEWASGDRSWYVNGRHHRKNPLGSSEVVGGLPAYEGQMETSIGMSTEDFIETEDYRL
jgi:hypothetical protein